MTGNKQRVVVAMSGGVDSSVAAALLVEAGYSVTGIMLNLWNEPGQECENRCCTPESMALARRVAAKIGIPFYTMDSKQPFYEHVVKFFINGTLSGQTPNPCGACNKYIRWNFLLDHALSLDAQFLATGHYAHISKSSQGLYHLHKGLDPQKDQSYILYSLTQNQLSHALFPLGNMSKTEVRGIAHSLCLPVADKPDSQDLCFLGDGSLREFVTRQSDQIIQPGLIRDQKNNVIGEHQGLPFYTIGQRKGLGISHPVPLYVLEKKYRENTIIVGPESSLGRYELEASEINWIGGTPPQSPFSAEVKIRYKALAVQATVAPLQTGDIRIKFQTPLRDITPGQIVVLYKQDECLGGGIIQ